FGASRTGQLFAAGMDQAAYRMGLTSYVVPPEFRVAPSTAGAIDSGLTVNIQYTPLQGNEVEFMRQLAGQEAGLNMLTAGEIRANIEAFNAGGRPSSATDAISAFRRENPVTDDPFVDAYMKNAPEGQTPRFAALHEPDMVIGGRASGVTGYGDLNVNSSIGAQNAYRQSVIYDAVKSALPNSYVRFVFGVTEK
ncbi:polymorphic toxin type 15 domain-containing protein, partial [Cupriavidus sp. 8B]